MGSSYIDLPIELKHPKEGLINIKSNDQKCFLWCHVRHINPLKEHSERIQKTDRKIVCNLNYDEIEFPIEEKDFQKAEVQNNICINVFCYENKIYVSDKTCKDSIDLLLLIDDDKSHLCTSKFLTDLCFTKQKIKIKKWFCRCCLQCFSSENVLIKHKEDFLSINGKQ